MPDDWGSIDMTRDRGAVVREAATVALLRDGDDGLEVLMVKRASTLEFHGGAWVFPGGRIDDDDREPEGSGLRAAQRAAARETLEEAGVVIPPEALMHFAQWTTPEFMPKRFDTWFFVAAVGDHAAARADGIESDELAWWRPADALVARNRREIELGPPQYVTCHSLARFATVGDALANLAAEEPFDFRPRFVNDDTGAVCLYAGDCGYDDAARVGEAGPRHRLLMPRDGDWEYQRG